MRLRLFDSTDDLSQYAADFITAQILTNPGLLLCAASGNSTTATYTKLGASKEKLPSDRLRIIKLDEWGGVSLDNPATCETYLLRYLIRPLHIQEQNYFSFNSNPESPEHECSRMQRILDEQGPIDLCILGLGLNGHIAFNEPDRFLLPGCHIASLSADSFRHPMAQDLDYQTTYGLTLGMADILKSRRIILLISGQKKAGITKALMSRRITPELPASFLWLHPEVYCFCDQEAYSSISKVG